MPGKGPVCDSVIEAAPPVSTEDALVPSLAAWKKARAGLGPLPRAWAQRRLTQRGFSQPIGGRWSRGPTGVGVGDKGIQESERGSRILLNTANVKPTGYRIGDGFLLSL